MAFEWSSNSGLGGSPQAPEDARPVSFSLQPFETVKRDSNMDGNKSSGVSTQRNSRVTCSYVYGRQFYMNAQAAYKSVLFNGVKWFTINLPGGDGYTLTLARFMSPPRGSPIGGEGWETTFELETTDFLPPVSILIDSSFRYLVTDAGDEVDYSAPDFDDSSWDVGNGPFGDRPHQDELLLPIAPNTIIPTASNVWIRKTLYVPAGQLEFELYFDNTPALYFNGDDVTVEFDLGNQWHATAIVTVPSTGVYTIAYKVHDTGIVTDGNYIYCGLEAHSA